MDENVNYANIWLHNMYSISQLHTVSWSIMKRAAEKKCCGKLSASKPPLLFWFAYIDSSSLTFLCLLFFPVSHSPTAIYSFRSLWPCCQFQICPTMLLTPSPTAFALHLHTHKHPLGVCPTETRAQIKTSCRGTIMKGFRTGPSESLRLSSCLKSCSAI